MSCREGQWAEKEAERANKALAASDVGWVVYPVLEQLVGVVVAYCLPMAGEEALALLGAMQQNPNLHEYRSGQIRLHTLRARMLRSVGHPEASLEAYRAVVKLNPEGFESWYELAYLQLHMGRLDEARTTAEKMSGLESARLQGNDSRLGELERYIDSASQ